MGNRNHLHVCQHCGLVHATSSSTPPTTCVVCDAFTFSLYEPELGSRGRTEPDRPVSVVRLTR
jgi:hypothetical protein